jgi:hypothetical protein
MPEFYVVASEEQLYCAKVQAENEEEAARIASELTEHEFEYLDVGTWKIIDIQKIQQKPKQAKLF